MSSKGLRPMWLGNTSKNQAAIPFPAISHASHYVPTILISQNSSNLEARPSMSRTKGSGREPPPTHSKESDRLQEKATAYNANKKSERNVTWLSPLKNKNEYAGPGTGEKQRSMRDDDSRECVTCDSSENKNGVDYLSSVARMADSAIGYEVASLVQLPSALPHDTANQPLPPAKIHSHRESPLVAESKDRKSVDNSVANSQGGATWLDIGSRTTLETSSLLRKEETFIVAARSNDCDPTMTPDDDLKQRKAMVLAKANARHAVRNLNKHLRWHLSQDSPSSLKPPAGNNLYGQQRRVYLKGTGTEVKTRLGERIYFRWKENEVSGKIADSVLPSGPSVFRRLYQYRTKRLKRKHSPSAASKSAPNKGGAKETGETKPSGGKQRSKTATVANDGKDTEAGDSLTHSCELLSITNSEDRRCRQKTFSGQETEDEKENERSGENNIGLVAKAPDARVLQTEGQNATEDGHSDSDKENLKTETTCLHHNASHSNTRLDHISNSCENYLCNGTLKCPRCNEKDANTLASLVLKTPRPPSPSEPYQKKPPVPYDTARLSPAISNTDIGFLGNKQRQLLKESRCDTEQSIEIKRRINADPGTKESIRPAHHSINSSIKCNKHLNIDSNLKTDTINVNARETDRRLHLDLNPGAKQSTDVHKSNYRKGHTSSENRTIDTCSNHGTPSTGDTPEANGPQLQQNSPRSDLAYENVCHTANASVETTASVLEGLSDCHNISSAEGRMPCVTKQRKHAVFAVGGFVTPDNETTRQDESSKRGTGVTHDNTQNTNKAQVKKDNDLNGLMGHKRTQNAKEGGKNVLHPRSQKNLSDSAHSCQSSEKLRRAASRTVKQSNKIRPFRHAIDKPLIETEKGSKTFNNQLLIDSSNGQQLTGHGTQSTSSNKSHNEKSQEDSTGLSSETQFRLEPEELRGPIVTQEDRLPLPFLSKSAMESENHGAASVSPSNKDRAGVNTRHGETNRYGVKTFTNKNGSVGKPDNGNQIGDISKLETPANSGQPGAGNKEMLLSQQEGATVAMATEPFNKNRVPSDDIKEHASRMNSSMSQPGAAAAAPLLLKHSEKNKTNFADRLGAKRGADSTKTDSLTCGKSHFSEQRSEALVGQVPGFRNARTQGGSRMDAKCAEPSIKMDGAEQMLKLNLQELNETTTAEHSPPLSISRYTNKVSSQSGQTDEATNALQRSKRTLKDMPFGKSITIDNSSTTIQKTAAGAERGKTRAEEYGTNSAAGNGMGLDHSIGANGVSQARDASDSKKNVAGTSSTSRQSITGLGVIHNGTRLSDAPKERQNKHYIQGHYTNGESINNVTAITNSQYVYFGGTKVQKGITPNSESQNTVLDKRNSDVTCERVQNNLGNSSFKLANSFNRQESKENSRRACDEISQKNLEQPQNEKRKPVELSKSKVLYSYRNAHLLAKDFKKDKATLKVHTQNVVLAGTSATNAAMAESSTDIRTVRALNVKENSIILKHTIKSELPRTDELVVENNLTEKHVNNKNAEDMAQQKYAKRNNGVIFQTPVLVRPKTAGISNFADYESEDLWSLNTGDEEDDPIQFIEGEQDFFKVFGYDEDTAAILMATRVYPVYQDKGSGHSGSINNKGDIEHYGYAKRSSANTRDIGVRLADSNDRAVVGNAIVDLDGKKVNGKAHTVTDHKKRAGYKTNNLYKGTGPVYKPVPGYNRDESGQGYLNIYIKHVQADSGYVKSLGGNQAVKNSVSTGNGSVYVNKKTDNTRHIAMADKAYSKALNADHGRMNLSKLNDNSRSEVSKSYDNSTLDHKNLEIQTFSNKPSTKLPYSPLPPQKLPSSPASGAVTIIGERPDRSQQAKESLRKPNKADPCTPRIDAAEHMPNLDTDIQGESSLLIPELKPAGNLHANHALARNQPPSEKLHYRNRGVVSQSFSNPSQKMHKGHHPQNVQETLKRRGNDALGVKKREETVSSLYQNTDTSIFRGDTTAPLTPSMHATDRVMQRLSNKDAGGIANRKINDSHIENIVAGNDSHNFAAKQPTQVPSSIKTTESPSRRKSHPVDSRTTIMPVASSLLAPRPRKLKPLDLHQAGDTQHLHSTTGSK